MNAMTDAPRLRGRYRDDPDALRALVRPESVHRDVYIDDEVFDLEMERLWARAWIYVGHDSIVPKAGDYFTADIGGRPVVMVRDQDATVRVLMNRCAHKGAKLVNDLTGNTGKLFRCPYHAWSFSTDGVLRGVPLRNGYEKTSFDRSEAARGLTVVRHVKNYRGFVFCRLSDEGMSFEEYFGPSLSSIDNMVDRSPQGRLEVAGGVLRYMHDCNWKMFVENLNDAMHPMVAHESSAGTAKKLWAGKPEDEPKPMAVEQFVPFTNGPEFYEKTGIRVWPNGHSYSGVSGSIHSKYTPVPGYDEAMVAAYGEERAHAILGEVRHNTVYYPSLTIKGAIQAIRIARPISANRTIVESWTFRLVGAPDALLQRTMMYSRLINAPTSVVGHDDLHCYRAIQQGLRADGNPWVSLHRGFDPAEVGSPDLVVNGTYETSMRNQFRAWTALMTAGEGA